MLLSPNVKTLNNTMVRVILSEAVVNSCMTITAVSVKFILSVKRRVANPVFIISYGIYTMPV